MEETPNWLKAGAEVAVLRTGPRASRVRFEVIDRVLKRDVVLSDGTRFSRQRLRRDLGNSAWDGSLELRAADDPQVLFVLRTQETRDAVIKTRMHLSAAETALGRTQDDPGDALDIVNEVRALLDEIRQELQRQIAARAEGGDNAPA